MNLATAISLATEKFKDKVDKSGQPYILHCLRVMFKVQHLGEEAMVIAVLHDIVEDTDITIKKLLELGATKEQCVGIMILTRDPSVTYDTYIHDISESSDTIIQIKLADLEDNLNVLRLEQLTARDVERINKYLRTHKFLKSKL